MSDLISRQAAIDAMDEVYCYIEMIKKRPVNKTEQAMYLDMIGAVRSVPSAQQKVLKYTGESICVYCRTTNCKGCIYEPMTTEVQDG